MLDGHHVSSRNPHATRRRLKQTGWRTDGALLALALGMGLHVLAAVADAACVGDCDSSGRVTIDEVLVGVNIALGPAQLVTCPSFDVNHDNRVTVDELLTAVSNALIGCPATPTITVTPPPTVTVTSTPTVTASPTPTVSPTSTPLPPTVTATATVTLVPLIFPANYRSTFVEVRNCRLGVEHDNFNIRVLANPVAAQPYLNDANPLPDGSIIVKEEFSASDCRDSSLVRWSAMRKEPGLDPPDGDWHWQRATPDRSLFLDDKTTCIGCHTVPACLARDHMCTQGGPPLRFILKAQPAALLSIAGTSAHDVYTVGADPGDDFGPYVLHYDGSSWRRLKTGANGDLWWISVTPIDGDFYMAGAGGLILRYDPSAGTFTRMTTPGTELLFGIWGARANDLWAVGGNPTDESGGGVLWHYDGINWSVFDLTAVLPNGTPTLYKVWGRNSSDVYIVGRTGTILHFDGLNWATVNSNTTRPLFTVHGNDALVAAVGGFANGVILELDGNQFVDKATPGTPQMNGVFIPPNSRGAAVGIAGAHALRGNSGWDLDFGLTTPLDFHATWIDPDGGMWAVGGDLGSGVSGIVAYAGAATIGSQVVPIVLCPPPSPNPDAVTTVSYSRDIAPLIGSAGCTSSGCHSSPFPSNSYDPRTYVGTFGPGLFAKSLKLCEIVPGDPDASFLLEKLGPSPRIGVRMPQAPRTPLSDAQIARVRTWILEGAFDDSPATPTATITQTPLPTRTATATRSPTPRTLGPSPTPNAVCDTAGIICTVAGTGVSGFDGDGAPALQTALYFPLEVVFDLTGRALINDWNNLRIRRINSDGKIETIMGTGLEDFPTNGALAVQTPLHHASDMAFDTQGNLYVAGDHVPVVFRVDTDNRVTVVAGTTDVGYDGDDRPATAAKMIKPFGVLPTANGGFYISDADANVIRFVDPAGIIHTIAGNGTRGYSGDGDLATAAQLRGR